MDLIAALLDPAAYPEPTREVALIQTHISWVFLTDGFAYKVKKPVDLGFLNFTTLRRRHHYLQRGTQSSTAASAPRSIWRSCPLPRPGAGCRWGAGAARVDYILKMVRLPQDRMMDEVADRGELNAEHLDRHHRPAGAVLRPGGHRPPDQQVRGARRHRLQPRRELFPDRSPGGADVLPGIVRGDSRLCPVFPLPAPGPVSKAHPGRPHPGLPRRSAHEKHLPGRSHPYL